MLSSSRASTSERVFYSIFYERILEWSPTNTCETAVRAHHSWYTRLPMWAVWQEGEEDRFVIRVVGRFEFSRGKSFTQCNFVCTNLISWPASPSKGAHNKTLSTGYRISFRISICLNLHTYIVLCERHDSSS
jgi:hypothetical protein